MFISTSTNGRKARPASHGVKHTQEMQETKKLERVAYATAPWTQGKV